MLSNTHRALEDFDNQHDFERMSADILNALGYSNVEPMAPKGGPDGGQDIKFKDGDTPGVAFATLEKGIQGKFKRDLEKQQNSEGLIALFCNVAVSPKTKFQFTKEAIEKGYRLDVFDLERLRSLLDSSFKEIRRRYLKIDDDMAVQIRSKVSKLLRFPDAEQDKSVSPTLIENMLVNKIPRRLFDLLMSFEERDILELPGIGGVLHKHLLAYYEFRQKSLQLEADLIRRIGQMVGVRFQAGWVIYYKYVIGRFSGNTRGEIIAGGDFLNYSISWDDTERVFAELSSDTSVSTEVIGLLHFHESLILELNTLLTSV